MSEANSQGEKTERPTPHRLREARRKGQVVKSTELVSAVNLLAVLFLLMLFGEIIFRWHVSMLRGFLGDWLLQTVSPANFSAITIKSIMEFLRLMSPIFVIVLAAGLFINYVQVGFILSAESISPQVKRLNPLEGFKKIVSTRALFEFVKVVLKIFLVTLIVYFFMQSRFSHFLTFLHTLPGDFFIRFSQEVYSLTLRVAVVLISLAIMDYLYQRHEFMKSMRMTKQEVKEEFKQMEGDPLIRAKLREKQRAMASQRMMQEVPQATVVITNPTELAVALKYEESESLAPKVVAKGTALMAARIKAVAKEHSVPIVENKPVARFLYQHVEIEEEVPVELYQAVAEILALVYEVNRLRGEKVKRRG